MGRAVYEVGEGDEGGGETDGGAVEGCDKDFWVRVEGIGYLEITGDEVPEGFAADVGVGGEGAGDLDIGAAGEGKSVERDM